MKGYLSIITCSYLASQSFFKPLSSNSCTSIFFNYSLIIFDFCSIICDYVWKYLHIQLITISRVTKAKAISKICITSILQHTALPILSSTCYMAYNQKEQHQYYNRTNYHKQLVQIELEATLGINFSTHCLVLLHGTQVRMPRVFSLQIQCLK